MRFYRQYPISFHFNISVSYILGLYLSLSQSFKPSITESLSNKSPSIYNALKFQIRTIEHVEIVEQYVSDWTVDYNSTRSLLRGAAEDNLDFVPAGES